MSHTCHARACNVAVRPELLMCGRHWAMVPHVVQHGVWRHYRAGQCDDRKPSREWFTAASAAVGFVAQREGQKFSIAEAEAMVEYKVASPRIVEGLKKIHAAKTTKKKATKC
jgi:hypothetical protein